MKINGVRLVVLLKRRLQSFLTLPNNKFTISIAIACN